MNTKIILAAALAVLIVSFFVLDLGQYFSLEYLKSQKQALNDLYTGRPVLVISAFFLLYVAVTSLGLPVAAILTMAAGAIFGLFTGFVLVSFASTIGATIAFLLTRYLFHDAVEARFGDRLQAINSGIEREGAFYVFGLRLVPIFPFFMVNSVLALTKLRTFTFYWASQLGMLAGTLVYVNAGTQLAAIHRLEDIVKPELLVSFVLLGVFPILAKYALAWLKKSRASA